MKKPKRFIAFLLMMMFLLGGCGGEGRNSETDLKNEETDEEKIKVTQMENTIEGFENASINYEKYNSYASENGLGDTLIYIEGKVLNQTRMGDHSEFPMLALVVEQKDGNRWCASITSDSEIEEIADKDVRIFGTYIGFSDVMNLPAISVATEGGNKYEKARVEIKEDDQYKTVWDFLEYTQGYENQKSDEDIQSADISDSSSNEYGSMLIEYGNIFFEELSVLSNEQISQLIQNGANTEAVLNEISLNLTEISIAETKLQEYYEKFDENRNELPMGTPIMTLLSHAQSALRQYAIALEHLRDYLGNPKQEYIDDFVKYMGKATDSLNSFNALFSSEKEKNMIE